MNLLLDLFLTLAKVGMFTFGGGYAMLPMLQKEVVENKKTGTRITRITARDAKSGKKK